MSGKERMLNRRTFWQIFTIEMERSQNNIKTEKLVNHIRTIYELFQHDLIHLRSTSI